MSVSFTLTQRRHPPEIPLNQRFFFCCCLCNCMVTKERVSIRIVWQSQCSSRVHDIYNSVNASFVSDATRLAIKPYIIFYGRFIRSMMHFLVLDRGGSVIIKCIHVWLPMWWYHCNVCVIYYYYFQVNVLVGSVVGRAQVAGIMCATIYGRHNAIRCAVAQVVHVSAVLSFSLII